ncbi:hypothetical protein VTK73DRAFT_10094 [Phialemonium thermophilum]|uniref:DNA mismatch repair protein MutS connector domain-containing protein n=1 Tax=Phialemonium thermophilum TaxID=223376 RepID=A0ABR3VYY6_9PEZI
MTSTSSTPSLPRLPPRPPRPGTPYSWQTSTPYSHGSGYSRACTATSTPYTASFGRPTRSGTTTGRSTAPGRKSRAASSLGASEASQVLCAVSEARGVGPSVGVALVNMSTGEAILSQICDTQFYVKTVHKVSVFEPSCILVASASCPPSPESSLFCAIEEACTGTPLVPLDPEYWSENAGLEYIQTLAFREDVEAINVAVEGKSQAICAFSAVRDTLNSLLSLLR